MLSAVYQNGTVGVWTQFASNLPVGVAWTAVTSSSTGMYQAVAAPYEPIYISSDYGLTWQESNSPNNVSWVALASSSNGQHVYAVEAFKTRYSHIDYSPIHISSDYGETWTSEQVGQAYGDIWRSVATDCSGRVVGVLGNSSSSGIQLSYNYGQTFQQSSSGTVGDTWFDEIAISCNGNYMIAVAQQDGSKYAGSGGIYINKGIGFPDDGKPINSITPTDQWTSCAINSNGFVMYAVEAATKGGVYKSTDQFTTWKKTMTVGATSSLYFSTVTCDESGLYVIASYVSTSGKTQAYSYLSLDGGSTWTNAWQRSTGLTGDVAVSLPPAIQMVSSSNSIFAIAAATPTTISAPADVYIYAKCAYGQSIVYVNGTNGTATGNFTCEVCAAGCYMDSYDVVTTSAVCLQCPIGTYKSSSGSSAVSSCLSCPYPYTTASTGATSCAVLYFDAAVAVALPVCGITAVWLCYLLYDAFTASEAAVAVMFYAYMALLTSILATLSQWAYVAAAKFSSVALFLCCIASLFCTLPLCLYRLVKCDAIAPTSAVFFLWLGHDIADDTDLVPFPTIYGKRFNLGVVPTSHSTLWTLFLEIFTWFVAVLLQGVTLIVGPLLLLLWFVIGIFLRATHLISITSVWKGWFLVWLGNHRLDDLGHEHSINEKVNDQHVIRVDTDELNVGLFVQFFFGTLPFICFFAANNTGLSQWNDSIPLVAVIFSLLFVFDMINIGYFYVYSNFVLRRKLAIMCIPVFELTVVGASYGYLMACMQKKTEEDESKSQKSPTRLPPYKKELDIYRVMNEGASESLLASAHYVDKYRYNNMNHDDGEGGVYPDNNVGSPSPPAEPGDVVVEPQIANFASPTAAALANRNQASGPPQLVAPAAVYLGTAGGAAIQTTDIEEDYVSVESGGSSIPGAQDVGSSGAIAHAQPVHPDVSRVSTPSAPPRAPPSQLLCPLTHKLMVDPVIAEDGYTYDRSAIVQYLAQYQCSPITQAPIAGNVIANRAIAELLANFNAGR
jgi:hypothetical protein